MNRVKEAKFYSVLFDETTDISRICQLSISLRYVYNNTIREDFISFANAYNLIREEDIESEGGESRLTGVALCHVVEDLLKKCGLDLKFCVGFEVDSRSVYASEVKGAVHVLKKEAKMLNDDFVL